MTRRHLRRMEYYKGTGRAIANMDIKLDFMPPSLINFVSRQLIGNGHKLYQKAVGSVATSDEEYREALKGPMYVRIREGLDSCNKHKTALVGLEEEKHAGVLSLEEEKHAGLITAEHTIETAVVNRQAIHKTFVPEIIEEDTEHSPCMEGNPPMDLTSTDAITDQEHIIKGGACISPEVEHALGILERAIAIVRGSGFCDIRSNCSLVDQESPTSERIAEAGSVNDETPNSNTDKLSNEVEAWTPEDFSCNGVDSASGQAHDNTSMPTEWLSASGNTQETNLNFSPHGRLIGAAVTPVLPPILDSGKVCDEQSLKANGFHESGPHSGRNKQNRKKKHRLCCLTLGLIRG